MPLGPPLGPLQAVPVAPKPAVTIDEEQNAIYARTCASMRAFEVLSVVLRCASVTVGIGLSEAHTSCASVSKVLLSIEQLCALG